MEKIDLTLLDSINNPIIVQSEETQDNGVYSQEILISDTEKVHNILLQQMFNEEYNARTYYQFYILLEQSGYKCAKLWYSYYEEELQHAKKIKDYLKDLNVKNIILKPIMFDGDSINVNNLHDVILRTHEVESQNYENLKNVYENINAVCDCPYVKTALLLLTEMLTEQHEELRKSLLLMKYYERTSDILQLDEFLASLV